MSLDPQRVKQRLEAVFYNGSTVNEVAAVIAALDPQWQLFVLDWVTSVARTQPELAYQFVLRAGDALAAIGADGCESWLQTALDVYFVEGLQAAVRSLANLDGFIREQRRRARGLEFGAVRGVLQPFLHGFHGRRLQLESGDNPMTDGETLCLPPVMDFATDRQSNFACYKAMAIHQWAQGWYGTWQPDSIDQVPREAPLKQTFHFLETLRLDACIGRDFPGLGRLLEQLRGDLPALWEPMRRELAKADSTVLDSIRLAEAHWDKPRPAPVVYQGNIDPDRVRQAMSARIEREKQALKNALARVMDEQDMAAAAAEGERQLQAFEQPQAGIAFSADGKTLPRDEEVERLVTSIRQDLGELPEDYRRAASDSEYEAGRSAAAEAAGEDWKAAFGDGNAFIYDEWDCTRRAHRKRWCAVREREVVPDHESSFVADTLQKYRGHIKSLRRSFEALRDDYRILKRQPDGEDLDYDALIEAIADMRSGMEMTPRIHRKAHRIERNIAMILMVDMSGSTKGWINLAQREALILIAEALTSLDDHYAIYGFSGNTRKRCEVFRIKGFDEAYNNEIRARIAAIAPQDYTRMGATIRHLSSLLDGVNARAKLLITLSDGKPDDYDTYHGEYGIEDTRMALLEARRRGIHPFCITIDEEARDYLPHMYGDVGYALVDDVSHLPYRISEIYRSLTG